MTTTRGLADFYGKATLASDCLHALERRGEATDELERHLIEICDRALEAYFWNDEEELARLAARVEEATDGLLERLARPGLEPARPSRGRAAAPPRPTAPAGVRAGVLRDRTVRAGPAPEAG